MRGLLPLLVATGCAKPSAPVAAADDAPPVEAPVDVPPAVLDPSHTLTRIAFGSCNDQAEDQSVWSQVAALQPELFLAMGDNVYSDVVVHEDGRVELLPGDLERLEAAYEQLAADAHWKAFRAAVPVMATWDDHDYGENDAGRELSIREGSEQLFLDFWDVPADDPRRRRPGVYTAQTFGPEGRRVQILMLDTRSFRSPLTPTPERDRPGAERYVPSEDPEQDMLGEAQWSWLEEQLEQPAELRLLVSSIQVAAEGHGFERWGLLPRERERLLGLLGRDRDTPVVVLSGDRHFGGAYVLPVPGGTMWEVTSSSLNKSFGGRDESGPHLLEGSLYGGENVGMVTIDWDAGDVALVHLRTLPPLSYRVIPGIHFEIRQPLDPHAEVE